MPKAIPFYAPKIGEKEHSYVSEALNSGKLSGDGQFTQKCHAWLESNLHVSKALLTHSCTAALEMAALLLDLGPGDEVIMPSFGFVSIANAAALRGATPVFIDIREDTINLDEKEIERGLTPLTKAIFVVHYAGVAAEMNDIMLLADQRKISVVEDAAQGIGARYKDRALGTIGRLGALSFHDTKNIVCGEGGALLINDSELVFPAEIMREKGTNRSQFIRGDVDKYSWMDIGSSYLPSELNAALLLAQLEQIDLIQRMRKDIWNKYHCAFKDLENRERVRRPIVPPPCEHNAHIYYLLVRDANERHALIRHLKDRDIIASFHYVPLHSAPAGLKYGKSVGRLWRTESISNRLIRLPLFPDLDEESRVIESVYEFFANA